MYAHTCAHTRSSSDSRSGLPPPSSVASSTTGMRVATWSIMACGAVRASTTSPSHRPAMLSTRPLSSRWWLAAMSTAYPLRRAARSMPRITSSYQ